MGGRTKIRIGTLSEPNAPPNPALDMETASTESTARNQKYSGLAAGKGVFLSDKKEEMIEFFTYIETEKILINYDTGNSAYWGFDQLSEIGLYGHLIGSVHIKDCTPERYSVPLGEGNVDFPRIFSLLKRIDYSGDFILQMARGSDDYSTAQKSFSFTKKLLNNFFYGTSTSQ